MKCPLQAVHLQDLRGVRTGAVPGLRPLTVLVGRNGAGKSTVLEALALAGAAHPAAMLGQLVQQRGGWNGAAYVVRSGAPAAHIGATADAFARRVSLSLDPADLAAPPGGPLRGPLRGPTRVMHVRGGGHDDRVRFDLHNEHLIEPSDARAAPAPPPFPLRFLHPTALRGQPLWRSLNEAVRSGRLDDVHALLRDLLGPGFRDLYPLPESDDGQLTNVHLRSATGSVPVDVAGDGVRALVRLSLELAGRPESVVLIEEPEVHLHPGALALSARAILAAVERGVQVILSTHSLELIDALALQASPEALDALAVIRLALTDGELRAHSIPGPDVRLLRGELAEDLR